MKLSILITLFALALNTGCRSRERTDTGRSIDLIPWLAASGKYGFCDSSGKLIIQPQYDDAYRFVGGFAVVGNGEKYGVINAKNQVVIPIKYPALDLVMQNGLVLAITKTEYNAWWRIWDWKILPEWNLLGGNSGPFLVTKVPRAHWKVVALPQKKTLFSDRRSDQYTTMLTNQYWKDDWTPNRFMPRDISIRSTSSLLAVKAKVYDLQKSAGVKKMGNGFSSFINDSTYITRNGKLYRFTDEKTAAVKQKKYQEANGIQLFTTSGDTLIVPKYGEMGRGYPIINSKIFIDQQGKTYLTADFSRPFPKVVSDYESVYDTVSAKAIFQQAVTVMPLPKTPYFLVLSSAGKGEKDGSGWKCYFLKENGKWKTDIPVYQGPQKILDNGEITLEGSRNRLGVLDTDFQFHPMPLGYIQPVHHHPHWYMGKDTATGKYGVYDVQNQRWQVPPEYDFLQDQVSADIAVYSIIKSDTVGDQLGLINMVTNKRITPPIFRRLSQKGRVVRLGGDKAFYIDVKTGKSYRENDKKE